MQNQNLSRTEAALRSQTVTTLSYDVSVDVRDAENPEVLTFPTESVITFEAVAGAETFLDFIGESVLAVFLNGKKLDVAEVVDGSRIHLRNLNTLNQVTVVARALYSRSGEGMHRFVDPSDGLTYLYTQYEPADSRRVFANFEQPDLKARFTFHVTAPAHWEVSSNGVELQKTPLASDSSAARWDFAETHPMSTYITTILAGPYFKAEDSYSRDLTGGDTLTVPLALYCRASMAESFDTDALFAQTKRGLDFFNELFDYPYPWGKYDQAFVPEYNLGAMENPGLVTFTEAYVFTSRATTAEYQGRANTLLHEMAHMWFGDLVTMTWWDDLWLKESFADYMGTLGVAEASDFDGSWITFANRRKGWAYVQDQLPTTHPIQADIPDLEAARQNFDGITYAKGASVLKQLVAYVGLDAFVAGSRTYFRKHAYGNTSLNDLLVELSAASGRDLNAWADAWLKTSGMSTLSVEVNTDDAGLVTAAGIVQSAVDPVTGEKLLRPHRLRVGFYDLDASGALVRTASPELDVTGAETELTALVGVKRPALILPNDEDLTYAKVRLDPESYNTVLTRMEALTDPMARALAWNALWDTTRDGLRPAREYVDLVARAAHTEPTISVLQGILANAVFAVGHYVPAAERSEVRDALAEAVLRQAQQATPGSDTQLAFARAVLTLGRSSGVVLSAVTFLLKGEDVIPGLVLDSDLRWSALEALAAQGQATVEELDAELASEDSANARAGHAFAVAARPTAEAKAQAWKAAGLDTELSNRNFSATIDGFTTGSAELTAPYIEDYFASLNDAWSKLSIGMASRFVLGYFPGSQDRGPAGDAVASQAQAWLDTNPDAPRALRRLVIEQLDSLKRSLKAQSA